MDVKYFPHQSLAFLMAFILLMTVGCGPAENDGKEKSTSDDQTAGLNPEELLVGTWYGKASLNQQLLQQKLASISDSGERAKLQQIAINFQSTEIGANFGENGEMLLDIQVNASGQQLRDSTEGQWRPLNVEKNAILIETTEKSPAGETTTNRVRYQFQQGGDVAIMVAPTSEQLATLNPVIVFERIKGESVADGANEGTLK